MRSWSVGLLRRQHQTYHAKSRLGFSGWRHGSVQHWQAVIEWAYAYSDDTNRAGAVEGTAGYGRGVTAALDHAGEWVLEFDRGHGFPKRPRN